MTNFKSLPPSVEKRGGARRPNRRRPKKAIQLTPDDYYKDVKGKGIFPKRLGQYRIVICTDLETDDIVALSMFTAWVKANERFFDARNNFPIYSFVVGETHNKRVKAQRAREFLNLFADILDWDDSEHHLYNGYQNAGSRVWFDGESDKTFDAEDQLLDNPEVLEDEEYPDPESFVTGIDELMEVKAGNLFILYLKPLRFFQSLKDRPEVFEYLQQTPGALYGGWNIRCVMDESPELKEPILRFLNRTSNEAPLLFTESFHALGEDNTLSHKTSPKLFRELDDAEEDELAYHINKTMYSWNDNILNRQITILQELPEFQDTDFDDYNSFKDDCKKLSPERVEEYGYILKVVDSIIKNASRQFVYADPLTIIATLIATGTLTKSPFRLQRSTIDHDGKYTTVTADDSSNTWVLLPKGVIATAHVKASKKLLEGMLMAAFKVTNE